MLSFTGQCAVHRGQIMRLHGAYAEALDRVRTGHPALPARRDPRPAGLALAERGEVLRIQGEYAAAEAPTPTRCPTDTTRSLDSPCCGSPEGAKPRLSERCNGCWQSRETRSSGRRSSRPRWTSSCQVGRTDEAGHSIQAMRGNRRRGIRLRRDCRRDRLRRRAPAAGAGDAAAALPNATTGPPGLGAGCPRAYDAARCRVLVGRALRALGDDESAVCRARGRATQLAELGAAPAEREAAAS